MDINALLKLFAQQQPPPKVGPQMQGPDEDFQGPTLEMLQQPPPPPQPQQKSAWEQMFSAGPSVGAPMAMPQQKPEPPRPQQQGSRSGFNAGNAMDLMMKTNPATMVQQAAMKKAMGNPGAVVGGLKQGANVLGEMTDSGKIFNDQPVAAPAPTVAPEAAPKEQGLLERLNAERGGTLAEVGPKPDMMSQVVGGADAEFEGLTKQAAAQAAAGGVDTPEKADKFLRQHFDDDPYLESVIDAAKQRYADARATAATPVGIADYLGWALLMLGGAHPMQAAEMVSRRGEKRQDENIALNDLNQAQFAKVTDHRDQRRQQEADSRQLQALMMHQQAAGQKEQQTQANHDQGMQFQRLKSGRGAALQQLNQLRQQQQYATDAKTKEAMQNQINIQKRRVDYFNKQLGEPADNETGMSPDVARLLGLG